MPCSFFPRHSLFHLILTCPQLFASSMGEFLTAAAALVLDLTQTIEATKQSIVSQRSCFSSHTQFFIFQTKLMKYLGSSCSEISDTEALGIMADFLAQFKKVDLRAAKFASFLPRRSSDLSAL